MSYLHIFPTLILLFISTGKNKQISLPSVEKKKFYNCLLTLDLLVSVYKDDAEGCGFEPATTGDRHVVPLTYIVDVDGNAGIGSDAVFLH